jgi:RHS repeat-associated protein
VFEQSGGLTNTANYNALNQLSTESGVTGTLHTNDWNAQNQLTAVNAGNVRSELTYDGLGRLTAIRCLTNGVESSFRRFVWLDSQIAEERNGSGAVTRRFFQQGMRIEGGTAAGNYYYTRDHLGSLREVVDSSGALRARYSYDLYGRPRRLSGDVEASFGFAGMFYSSETGFFHTRFRAYDPEVGRWLSRDPLADAELQEGPNLYLYAANNPVNLVDPLGLCCEEMKDSGNHFFEENQARCHELNEAANQACAYATQQHSVPNPNGYGELGANPFADGICADKREAARKFCDSAKKDLNTRFAEYLKCLKKPCVPATCSKPAGPAPAPRSPSPSGPGVTASYPGHNIEIREIIIRAKIVSD